MNTKWIVTLIVTLIIVTISIVYAFVQTVKAQAAEREALAQKELAVKANEEARLSRVEAEKQAAFSMTLLQELEALRKKCK